MGSEMCIRDRSLVKQFDAGTVVHARDVVIDTTLDRAFASATGTPNIAVFDAKALAFTKNIEIKSTVRGENFSVGSLHLDPAVHKLYAVSLSTNEAAVIDGKTETVEKVFPVEGAKSAIGVAPTPRPTACSWPRKAATTWPSSMSPAARRCIWCRPAPVR